MSNSFHSSWISDRLGKVPVEFVDGDRSAKYPKRSEFALDGILFLNAESISDGRLNASKANFITREKYDTIKKGRLQSGDLILTTRGNGVGKPAFFDSPRPALINAQLLIIRPDPRHIIPKFLYYSFCDPDFQSQLRNFTSGSAQPQLPITSLRDVEVRIAPISTQRKIAAILSTYDDLIENNTRRIAILEEMAQAIYREWFINFRFPGHEKVKMVDSQLGKIPKAWEVSSIGEIIETIGGGTPSTKNPEYWDGGDITWYSPTDLTKSNTMFIRNSATCITDIGLRSSSARMFPAYSVMMTSRATIGVIAINTTPACTNQGFITCIPNERLSAAQLYYWLIEKREEILVLCHI